MKFLLSHISGSTVLLVEDEPDLALLVKTCLVRKGCKVYISHTFQEAMSKLTQVRPDAILFSKLHQANIDALAKQVLRAVPSVKLITCGDAVAYTRPDLK